MPDILASYQQGLAGSCRELLEPYLARLQALAPSRREPKEFNDPVWGTILVFPLEIVVLDSPLLQRLRHIRQLGVVHLVYPAATHSRFEHALGTMHQVQQLVNSINGHSLEPAPPVPDELNRLLRVTALCHDLGHSAMSHVSENALSQFDHATELRLAFADEVGVEKVSLSEMAAYYVISSDQFRQLIDEAQRITGDHFPPDKMPTEFMRDAIIGKPVDDGMPLLHELINGPFDADKLDYMTRDAIMTGVPVVTDIDRLVQKVRAARVEQAAIPEHIRSAVRGGLPSYIITGVARSGARTLDELILGRTLQFDKVYRHQKVRAAEGMVASMLRCISPLFGDEGLVSAMYRLTDNDVLRIDERTVDRLLDRELSEDEQAQLAVASDLSTRLANRELFVRAFAFAQSMPLDPYRNDDEQRLALVALLRATEDANDRAALSAEVKAELTSVLTALNRLDLLKPLPANDVEPYLWIDPPAVDQPSEVARACLIDETGPPIRFRDDYAETRGWADAYVLTRDVGYIFTTAELAPFVFIAAEAVIRQRFGVRIPRTMLSYAKQDPGVLSEIHHQLVDAGYFADLPRDLLPLPERLERADIDGRVATVLANIAGYVGPTGPSQPVGKMSMDRERVLDWVRQFEHEELVDAALRAAEHIRVVGRREIIASLTSFMDAHPEFRGAALCPLGTAKDSSSMLAYYSEDIAPEFELTTMNLAEALAEGRANVVFVDDFIGLGSQSITILEAWLGEPLTFDLGEERPPPLIPELRDIFRGAQLGVVFSAGQTEGLETLLRRAEELGLSLVGHVEIADDALPRCFGAGIFASTHQEEAFKTAAQGIGSQLLLDPSVGHDEAWVQERALGYGNNGLLVAFPYNTPSQTLACLWKPGEVEGTRWSALLPRRTKR